jgi:hypothetical protein
VSESYWLREAAALRAAGRPAEAVQACRKAVELSPTSAQSWHALAQALRHAGDLEGALAAARRTVELAPNVPASWATLGVAFMELGNCDEAESSLRHALTIAPNDAAIRFNLGEALLLKGSFREGWPYFEAGRFVGNMSRRLSCPQPQWDGGLLTGRTILLYADGGFGDAIMFARYAPLLRDRGARVLLLCHPELVTLLSRVSGITQVVAPTDPVPAFDVQLPLISLPRLMDTTLVSIPAEIPYLTADPTRAEFWRRRMESTSRPRIGLAWAGAPSNINDFQRSIPIEQLQPLAALKDTAFYSLQKGRPLESPRAAAMLNMTDWTDELKDFADTAALIAGLDLVIAVDTAVAHLAGALAKPVWTLLPFAPDWRWMLHREDSPWYSTMRLFRQARPKDWEEPLARVAADLKSLAGHVS